MGHVFSTFFFQNQGNFIGSRNDDVSHYPLWKSGKKVNENVTVRLRTLASCSLISVNCRLSNCSGFGHLRIDFIFKFIR